LKVSLLVFILFFTGATPLVAQQDSSTRSTYFLEQSAFPYPKGSLSYNNYYLLANSIAYNVTERLKVAAGVLISSDRPPFYVNVQYSFPLSPKVSLGGSVGFYQVYYSSTRSSYLIAPQVLCTIGNQQVNTTVSAGVVRGRFLFGGGFLLPSSVNLPDRVNLSLSISHRRSISKELSLITQNAYISAQLTNGNRYADIFLLSGGLAWHLNRNTIKGGLGAVLLPDSEQDRRATLLPFVGYAYTIK
jgi:hypothetical protein